MADKITISVPQGWSDVHIERLAEKIMGGCIGLMIPYDEKRFRLIKHRVESVIYNYIQEQPSPDVHPYKPKEEK